jgi:hypothetical protein
MQRTYTGYMQILCIYIRDLNIHGVGSSGSWSLSCTDTDTGLCFSENPGIS